MKPAPFQYHAPTTLDEALALLHENADSAKLLAGGQSLVPVMNFRLATPTMLIDLNRVSELFYIRTSDFGSFQNFRSLSIGAMTRHRQVERDALVAQHAPLLAETMPFIAHPQIRNRGTIGGSLAHADPAAELPAVMIALDAQFKLRSHNSERIVPARDFFTGLFMTALQPNEMIAEVQIPALPPRAGWAFDEVSRRHGDYALAGCAAFVTLDDKGNCKAARLVLLGMGAQPINAQNATRTLIGQQPTPDAIRAVSEALDAEVDPTSDMHASADFRRHLAKVLAKRVLETAFSRAQKI
jgi:CO/xanthine dehydrogenase FAD-binding subunit